MGLFGITPGDITAMLGAAGILLGGYWKLKADIGNSKLDAQKNLTAAEQTFRTTLIEQEARCRIDNDKLRLEMNELRASSRAASVIANVAETQLQIVKAIESLRAAVLRNVEPPD